MRIRTMFIITMTLFGLLLVVVATSLVVTNQQVDRLNKQEEIAINIERAASELSYLSNDYLLYREDQQHIRWETKWSSISHDLAQLRPDSPEQQVIADNIKDNHQRLRVVFDNVASAFQDTTQTPVSESIQSLTQVSWSRLAVQNQGIAFDALHLSQVIRDQKDQSKQTNSLLIFALLGAFSAYFIINYMIVQRRLLKSITDLQSGAKVIGSGNLDFALEVKRDDEIGELSHTFNQMTADLKGVTASKADLEREIAERKRAEEALEAHHRLIQEQNEELEVMNEELQSTNEELITIQHTLIESKEFSDALNYINAAITSTLDVDAILQRVVAESAQAINCESAWIMLRDEDGWVTKYVYNMPQEQVGARFSDSQVRITTLAAQEKKTIAVDDARSDKRIDPEMRKKYGTHSVMAVPLISKEEVIGAISFNFTSSLHTFSDSELDFANKLGPAVSLAMENARLYEAERHIANTLQGALLTVPERIEGMEFGYLYRSATEAAKVGGDFYDIFELENDRVGIIIGDVSGKGIKAATLTSLVRNTIRAYAYEEELPSVILKKANEAIRRIVPVGSFITLFLGIVDMRSGELLYCSAGHPSVLLKRKTAGVELLEVSSPIIGAFAGLDFIDSTANIKVGDVLFLYTDGITEARCGNDLFREERLVELLNNLEIMSAKDVPHAVFGMVMECTGGRLADDVALLSISLLGVEAGSHA
ncbi:MAG: SpoIIE family protein phosphatase [Candidatus Aquicultor sp.]